jgi:hypothetical protein
MNTKLLDGDAILAKYAEQKPVCVNYVEMREELLALADENAQLRSELFGQSIK